MIPFKTDMGIFFFFFTQLVFSTYLSVVLLKTSHNLRGKERKFGSS